MCMCARALLGLALNNYTLVNIFEKPMNLENEEVSLGSNDNS